MRTLRGPSRSLKSLHQIVSTSDVPFVTRRHTRVGIRRPPDVLSVITLLADGDAEFTCEPEDLCFVRPVRARRASARERLSSYREPASRNPQAMYTETCWDLCTRAPFRLLSIRAPRQAVLRTSSWLAPSRSTRPCDLPVEKTRDASNRCLPPKRITCTRTSRVPGSLSQLSLRGRPAESKAPWSIAGGPDVSRRPKDRFGGSSSNTDLELYCLTAWRHERGRFLPTVLMRSSL
jgi:hypothetical protein